MKSNRSIGLLTTAVLGLLVAFLFPRSANAQAAFHGSFTLPVETRWGPAALRPGTYKFTLPSVAMPAIITVRGEGKAALIMATAYNERRSSGHSTLTLVRHGTKGTVRSLYLAEPGLTFYFTPPKGQAQILAQAPELIQRVRVAPGK